MIDPAKVCLWVPPDLKKFKLDLFNSIASKIQQKGGSVVRHDERRLEDLPDDILPIVGCHPPLKHMIAGWKARGRQFCVLGSRLLRPVVRHLPAEAGVDAGELLPLAPQRLPDAGHPRRSGRSLEADEDRGACRGSRNGRHIVIAANTATYAKLHGCEDWLPNTVTALAKLTDRQLVVRDKEHYQRRPIQKDLDGAHCLVTHG